MNLSGKFSRRLLCLALAFADAGVAYAGPAGPSVSAGRASYDPATLTVNSASARTQIGWQSFNVGAGEVVNFIQPDTQSSVLNIMFNPQTSNVLGGLRSNGSVLFMINGQVSGPGVNLDLASTLDTSLRIPHMALALSGTATPAQPLTTLAQGSIYVISQDERALTTANGDVVLNPGKTIELAHASMISLRVGITAPNAEAINLSRLVGGKSETGIFAGLFRVPAAARQAAQPDAGATLIASAAGRTPDFANVERFYRYALSYAQIRREALLHEGGMMQVAAAPSSRMMLPALMSRSSVLPREIEIGAPRPQEAVLRPASLPRSVEADRPAAKPESPAASIAEASGSQGDSTPLLAYVSVEPPAETIATRKSRRVTLAAASEAQADSAPVLVLAAAEPPMSSVQKQPAQGEFDAAQVPPEAQPAATVIVVAQAQTRAAAAPQEESGAKEQRIERRAPRYFTDYRGALFFM